MNTVDVLAVIEEKERINIKELSMKLKIPEGHVEKILRELSEHNIVDYNEQTGEVMLSQWFASLEKETEEIKAAVTTIILPKNQEIRIEDVTLGNYTDMDLEIYVRLKAKKMEIALSKLT